MNGILKLRKFLINHIDNTNNEMYYYYNMNIHMYKIYSDCNIMTTHCGPGRIVYLMFCLFIRYCQNGEVQ